MDNGDKAHNEKMEQKEGKKPKPRFNAGGNDADFDGGRPTGGFPEESEQLSEESEEHNTFNTGNNDSDYDGGHPGDSFPSKK